MKKDTIVQFVCFDTNLDFEEFETIWEQCASQFVSGILQKSVKTGKRNKYISQHECRTESFRFAFIKGDFEYFPENVAKVTQIGGYAPVQIQCPHNEQKDDVKIIVFINNPETDFTFYHRQTYRHLNIYQAYYENCTYSYILEFFVQEGEAETFVNELKVRHGVEAGIYAECAVSHA